MSSKSSQKKQQFWPGSNIVKSSRNAFDWRTTSVGIYSKAELGSLEQNVRAKLGIQRKPITTYSRAKTA